MNKLRYTGLLLLFLILFAVITVNVSAAKIKPPIITITSPQNSLYNTTNIQLNVSANEGISIWEYSLNGGANVTFTPNTTINASYGVSQGANSIIVYAKDRQGYWNSSRVDFSVDSVPPVISIASPQNFTFNSTDIPLNVSANEAISTWNYSLNGGANVTFTPNIIINSSYGVSQGANSIIVYARDIAGNWNSSRVDFSVDSVPPIITITSPLSSLYNKTSIPLNASANEAISIWNYSLNSGANIAFDPTNTTITASQGENSIIVYARDTAGNWNSSTVNFSVDSILPVITIASPHNLTYNSTDVHLNVSANEMISIWSYSLNGEVNIPFTPNITITSSQGANNITVHARDTAGNWNSSVVDFQVDTIAPLSITDLISINYAHDYINWTWTDPASDDFSHVIIYLNGEFKTNVPNGIKFYNAIDLIPDTEYTIGTQTVDKFGNINQTWVNHTLRTSLPPPPPIPCDSSCSWTVNYIIY